MFTPTDLPQSYGSKITPLAFLKRLGLGAEVAIETAAESDVVVRVLLRRVTTAKYIDLTDGETQAGLAALVAKSLLTPAQVNEVLSMPVQAGEVP